MRPTGIDLYFDNVGGEQLEAAIGATKDFARDRAVRRDLGLQRGPTAPPPGPRNLHLAIARRLRIEGFIVIDHFARLGEFLAEVAPLVAQGAIKAPVTFVDGIENAPRAFMDILRPNATWARCWSGV